MGDFFKGTIDKVDILLRTIAPGFIALLAIFLADPSDKTGLRKDLFVTNIWQGIGFATILGFISYAFHAAVLEDFFFVWVVIPLFKRLHNEQFKKEKFPYFKDSPLSKDFKWQMVSALSRERWFRRGSPNLQVLKMQEQLDKTFAWLIFLYCSGYLLVVSSVYYFCISNNSLNSAFIFFGGLISLLCAIAQDVRVTRHELWLCMRYPQFNEIHLYAYERSEL